MVGCQLQKADVDQLKKNLLAKERRFWQNETISVLLNKILKLMIRQSDYGTNRKGMKA